MDSQMFNGNSWNLFYLGALKKGRRANLTPLGEKFVIACFGY
jgi:hypothetical protein